ncbi:MerR family transcriptional regulator [Nocardiopsis sp. CNR-923]|uniref:MerR family transcriptional regulator n=1 Tax=Nocardiopsis sp. CNR-923 TaxID=1904965 RepID=UPI00096AA2F3|nr:MerR family transcriptional regulator [Nocardiopsis sp. CNR-923]
MRRGGGGRSIGAGSRCRILPCLDRPRSIHFPDATPEMLALLEHERDRMSQRIACLSRNRNAISEYLEAVRDGSPPR